MNATLGTLADRMRRHGQAMAPGLERTLLLAFADDYQAGGIVADICRDWADAPDGAVIQLRLLAGLQRLALRREAAELIMFYPHLGGGADPAGAWPVFRPVLQRFAEQLRSDLLIAPQTNDPGRSVALLVGIFDVVRRAGLSRLRLLEVGASAGLNLLVDQYRISGEGWSAGPSDSPLVLGSAVIGTIAPVGYQIVSRRGCDVAPVDPTSQDGRLRLTSFVWAHHLHRHERLRAALQVAAPHPPPVDAAPAAAWLAEQLAEPPEDQLLTVVWHSVTKQYWPAAEVDAVAGLIRAARDRMPIAEIGMEHPLERKADPAELSVQLSVPGGVRDVEPVLLATVADHGVPVTMLDR